MSSGFYGWSGSPPHEPELTVTDLRVGGKAGATAGADVAGGTTSGAPTTGTFNAGDVVVDQAGQVRVCTAAGTPGTWALAGDAATVPTRWEPITDAAGDCLVTMTTDPVMALAGTAT